MPSGNQPGANEHRIARGVTRGGVHEGAIDPIPSGDVRLTPIPKSPREPRMVEYPGTCQRALLLKTGNAYREQGDDGALAALGDRDAPGHGRARNAAL